MRSKPFTARDAARNGDTETGPDCARTLFADTWDPRALGQVYGTTASDWPLALADLRAYDRALTDEEIPVLCGLSGE
ncbi:MAG: hypothetical protein JW741_30715 [Sedimentisphaerales bacterium]|nr:hypothetical protein [Sedimentisphaerales bacterium]